MMLFGKRGLVAKISDGYCVILTSKGTYERIPVPPQGGRVGAEVSYRAASPPILRPMMLVASLLILFVCYSLFRQASLPVAVAYVSLDINPSLELSVDKNLNVIDVKCFNDDAVNLLKQENLKGKPLDAALATVVNKAIEQNYIKPGQDNLIVSTVTTSVAAGAPPVDQQAVQQFLEKSINKGGLTGDVRIYSATGEFRTEAENDGLSPGKYLIYEQLVATGNKVSIDDIRNNSIRKLVDTYKINLLPNYKNIRIQKRNNGEEPEILVDDNGKAVSIADFFKAQNEGGSLDSGQAGTLPKAKADNGQGVQPKSNLTGKNQNNKQVSTQPCKKCSINIVSRIKQYAQHTALRAGREWRRW
jgi:hypothetical protein